ncbi:rho guanine nucleotide exchange factor 3-like [Fopius arisanus]|uniref:Rho guanine nucleotide exchange factor 3-like n=1 Tax=Fopius arisanus TaxID=64838 RepID=A0A9R1T0Z2_9HYME|nr:PREDICTED: rho guanine nucleotide exchange factor 3-like [Fopius arisanus]
MTDEFDENLDETFQEPRKRFWQRSSRKRTKSDAISISSMDISLDSTMMKRKKRRRITEFATNLLSSSTTTGRLSNVLQRSFGFQQNNSISMIDEEMNAGPSKRTRSICERAGNLAIRSWVTDVAGYCEASPRPSNLGRTEVKRQEAIYELYCGENILLNDLITLKETYYEPLQMTDIFTPSELRTLFGDLDMLVHVHSKLRDDLVELRDSSGFTDIIGPTLLEWLPTLVDPYVEKCKSQILARHILDEKRLRNKKFQEFLKRRMESPKAVDLWTYLDTARSRVVKYPLLVNEILKRTPTGHEDRSLLEEAKIELSKLLERIDRAMGDAECELARSKINVKEEYDPEGCIIEAVELITEGQLKDAKGLKLHCFLFDTCLAFTRRVVRSRVKNYNLTRLVIPKAQLKVQTDCEGNGCAFKIGEHSFVLRDEHDKRHWMDAFEKVHRAPRVLKSEKPVDKDNKDSNGDFSISRVLRNKQVSKRTVRERPI